MGKTSLRQCMKLALETGRIILESGGATNRVELMIHKVCSGLGYPDCESFVTPTGIFLTISDGEEEMSTSIKRIDQRRMDLGKITEISRVVNCLYSGDCNEMTGGLTKHEYFAGELKRISHIQCGSQTSVARQPAVFSACCSADPGLNSALHL